MAEDGGGPGGAGANAWGHAVESASRLRRGRGGRRVASPFVVQVLRSEPGRAWLRPSEAASPWLRVS